MIFETNKYIYKWLSAWLLTVKAIVGKGRPKFLSTFKDKNLKKKENKTKQ